VGPVGTKNPDTHIAWGRGFLRSCNVATYGCGVGWACVTMLAGGSACAGGLGVGGVACLCVP